MRSYWRPWHNWAGKVNQSSASTGSRFRRQTGTCRTINTSRRATVPPVPASMACDSKVIAHHQFRPHDRWVRDMMVPDVGPDGTLLGWQGVLTDITQQRALADDLRGTTSMFHALLANLPAGVFFVQAESGRPILVNARARQLLGQREDLAASLEHLSIVYRLYRHDGTPYPVEELPVLTALRRGATCIRDDIVVHRPDGRRIPLVSWAAPVDISGQGRPEAAPNGDDIEVTFREDEELSERVIFPITDAQANGIEDAQFVEFNDGARKTFYATYTAYSGRAIRSELIETTDFRSFRITPLSGGAARNKGMALFPRKIDGRYAMIGRQDNENLYLIYSDDLYTWEGGRSILQPEYPWEFVQIGNCGSPVELDDCWLLLTHGVGPIRKYSIGAVLLDKKDPSKILARSREPLVRPEPTEREGYVPNVVYTCGAMRHSDQIILPYAISDTFSNFATIKIAALMQALAA